ncbi:MATE family efflux transporter [Methanolapillus millepedarum]|uniref:Multidrug export protein MepA n=1 Tax=Methanolapillus millepedarum TaxID=3028296 RepID=A0AA96V4W3_9EURY|nr:Multidrug export protein MepA [Methanosarcinaceae archaeon Ac7]
MTDKFEMMETGSVKKALAWLAAPAIVSLTIQTLYGFVDTVFVGRGLGADSVLGLGALTIAFPIAYLVVAASSGVGVGGSSYISRGFGAKDEERVKKGIGNMIILGLLVSLIFTLVGFFLLDPTLRLFGATDTILPFAKDYMYWILIGCVFQVLTITLTAIVMAEGNATYIMGMYLVSSLTNIVLDYVFIFIFDWGIAGAAIATVIAQILNFLILVFYMYRVSSLKFSLRWVVFDRHVSSDIVKIGVSEFIREGSLTLMFIIVNRNLVIYGGDVSIAIFGLINRIFGVVIIPVIGIVQGMIPLTGYNYGAKNFSRVREIFKTAAIWAVVGSLVLGVVSYIFTAEIFALFTTDLPLIEEAVIAYWLADLSIPIVAFAIVGSAFLQALGKAKESFLLTIARQIFILPVLTVIPIYMGLTGVWVSFPVVDTMTGILTLWFVFRQLNVLKKEEEKYAAKKAAVV